MRGKLTLIARLSRVVAEGVIPRLEAVERQLAAMQPSASAIVAKADDDGDDQTELEALIADMEKRQADAEARLAALEAERPERKDS